MNKKLLIIAFLWATHLSAQRYILDSVMPTHGDLYNTQTNRLKFATESPYFDAFFKRLDSVYEGKNDKLHIFHIGG